MIATSPAPPLQADVHGIRYLEFKALGTHCSIKFRLPDERAALVFAAEALGWIGKFEAKFSRFQTTSLVSRINAAAGAEWVTVDDEMEHLLKLADDQHRRTHGILDPTLLPLLRVWDWKQVHLKLYHLT